LDCYRDLEGELNETLGTDLSFGLHPGTSRYRLTAQELAGFRSRHAAIREFQEITRSLFNASLEGEADPEIARLILNELPETCGWNYHRQLGLWDLPVFFRSDEVEPGAIVEIQSPGSTWGICDLVQRYCDAHQQQFGASILGLPNLAEGFSGTLRKYLGTDPAVHHLTDHSSIPHDVRFFIQRTRKYGIRYFSYDREVTPYTCNFVRAHSFLALVDDIYAGQRLERFRAGSLRYDLPPSILFDEKMIYMLPFWEKTRGLYPDSSRSLFPYTQLIRPEGLCLADGSWIDLESFCRLSRNNRAYYIKFAGCDLSINWGSKAVYQASSFSVQTLKNFMDRIVEDFGRNRFWIIQEARHRVEESGYFTREGDEVRERVYTKFSGFYGPEGLLGILVMQRPFHKVHGSEETIVLSC
jgi:hypothetical protein